MKRYYSILLSAIAFAVVFAFAGNTVVASGVPSHAAWFQQSGFEFDSTSKTYTIHLKWRHGIIDEYYPKAEGYYVYRSMIGYAEELEDYELVGIVTDDEDESGFIYFSDVVTKQGGYFYYLKGFIGENFGAMTSKIQAFSLGSYCVNLNAEIVDFVSFPKTVAVAGEVYKYEAYARHRSPRVQGWVRYALLDGPEGMQIDNKTGILTWDIPFDAEGDYYVEIKATSEESKNAESIQEWYIRIANEWDLKVSPTSIVENERTSLIHLYPNPAGDYIEVNQASEGSEIRIYNAMGECVLTEPIHPMSLSHRMNVEHLPAGVYFVRIGEQMSMFVKQ